MKMRHIKLSQIRSPNLPTPHHARPSLLFTSHLAHQTRHHTTHQSSTVDPNEVTHFNALASTWWDPHGPSRLLHLMNPIRHQFLRSCLATDTALKARHDLRVLDIGCGGGIFAESAARLPQVASVTAIDPSSEVLNVAREHQRRDPLLATKLTYVNTTIEELTGVGPQGSPRPAGGYDVVSLFEVLEHVPHPSAFLGEVGKHVKPGGWIVMSTIARTWLSWLVTNVVAEDVLGIVPKGTHDWNKYINEVELRQWFMQRSQWERPRAMGVVYVPGFGWKEVPGGENVGNYFFAIRRKDS